MNRKRFHLSLISCIWLCAAVVNNYANAQSFTDSRFTAEIVGQTGAGVTSLAFGPGGIMYAIEKRGRVMAFETNDQGGYRSPVVFADLRDSVFTAQESGLLGIALDPSFSVSRQMYLFYTTQSDQRVVRLTASSDFSSMTGTAYVVLDGLPRVSQIHKGGDLEFDPNNADYLYIAVGDDGDVDAAQNLDAYNGKILKVNKNTGLGASDNPFVSNGNLENIRARVWSLGHRNPFRIDAHPQTPRDVIYVSENGNQTDRFSWVEKGANGAWNSSGDSGGFLNPPNTGPGSGVHTILDTFGPSAVGVALVSDGAFADPDNSDSVIAYVARWGGDIMRWRLTDSNLDTAIGLSIDEGNSFMSGDFASGIDLVFGPDGWLYYTQSINDDAINAGFTIKRIRTQGSSSPTANFNTSPSPAIGNTPFEIDFRDSSTSESGSEIVSYSWTFGDGQSSNLSNPQHTYANPGTYIATLSIIDSNGLRSNTQRTVTSLNTTNCSNLTLFPVTPAVSYSNIQSIWNNSCIGCHATLTPAADLDLSTGSRPRIVNVESLQASGRTQVVPFSASSSYLFEKINCAIPEIGQSMPLSNMISLSNQALIRDWINQGATESGLEEDQCFPVATETNKAIMVCF